MVTLGGVAKGTERNKGEEKTLSIVTLGGVAEGTERSKGEQKALSIVTLGGVAEGTERKESTTHSRAISLVHPDITF